MAERYAMKEEIKTTTGSFLSHRLFVAFTYVLAKKVTSYTSVFSMRSVFSINNFFLYEQLFIYEVVANPLLMRGSFFRKTAKIAGHRLHNEKSRYSKQWI